MEERRYCPSTGVVKGKKDEQVVAGMTRSGKKARRVVSAGRAGKAGGQAGRCFRAWTSDAHCVVGACCVCVALLRVRASNYLKRI